jgi:hypothetical protein
MVLYTGAGHQRIIFRCFVYSFVFRRVFTFHGARRGVGRRVSFVIYTVQYSRAGAGVQHESALYFTLFSPLERPGGTLPLGTWAACPAWQGVVRPAVSRAVSSRFLCCSLGSNYE